MPWYQFPRSVYYSGRYIKLTPYPIELKLQVKTTGAGVHYYAVLSLCNSNYTLHSIIIKSLNSNRTRKERE